MGLLFQWERQTVIAQINVLMETMSPGGRRAAAVVGAALSRLARERASPMGFDGIVMPRAAPCRRSLYLCCFPLTSLLAKWMLFPHFVGKNTEPQGGEPGDQAERGP